MKYAIKRVLINPSAEHFCFRNLDVSLHLLDHCAFSGHHGLQGKDNPSREKCCDCPVSRLSSWTLITSWFTRGTWWASSSSVWSSSLLITSTQSSVQVTLPPSPDDSPHRLLSDEPVFSEFEAYMMAGGLRSPRKNNIFQFTLYL